MSSDKTLADYEKLAPPEKWQGRPVLQRPNRWGLFFLQCCRNAAVRRARLKRAKP